MFDPKHIAFASAEYIDEDGETRNLYDLRDEIEADCIDFTKYKQQGRKWLQEYGVYINGKKGENYRDAIGQYLFLQCLGPLQAGLSRTNVMNAVGMYIGMSLVCKDVRGQYKNVMKSGCDNILGVLESNDKTKNSKLHSFVEKIRDKQVTKLNHGRIPHTPMSAAMEYLRIENATYALMREPQEQMTPPSQDHITEAYYDYKTISKRDDVSSEVVDFYKHRFERFQRAVTVWDDLSNNEKKDVYIETVRLDADKAKEILYYTAIEDGVSPEMIKDNVSHIIGNALIRDADVRKKKRHEQRGENGSVIDEIKDAYRNGVDPEVSGIADVFNQTSYGVGSAEMSELESILEQDVDENGVIHSVIKDKWDGTFKNTVGKTYEGEFEAREPLNVSTAPLAMSRAMGIYIKEKGVRSASDILSAMRFVEAGSVGQNLDMAYIDTFGNMFDGKTHDDVRSMRNLVTDLSHIVDQMKRDGVDEAQVQSVCLSAYRASIFNAYLDDNLSESCLDDNVKAAMVQNAFSDVNMCVSHGMEKSDFVSEIVPARCKMFYETLDQCGYCKDKSELKEATKAYGRFLTMFYGVANKEKEVCEKQGVSYQQSRDLFVNLIANYSADKCTFENKDQLEIKIDEYKNRVTTDAYRYADIKSAAHYMKDENEKWYNRVVNNNYGSDGRGGPDEPGPDF